MDWSSYWTNVPGSHAGTTSYTLTSLAGEVEYTFELRAVRGNLAGQSAQVAETPLGDVTLPSQVRELRAVIHSNIRIQLYFRAPERSGDAEITGYEYRYAAGNAVPDSTSWQTASSSQVSNRTISISNLEGETLYTFEVRAVNGNNKRGAPARVQATTSADPAVTPPSAPGTVTPTPGKPYTEVVSVEGFPARVAFVDVTVEFTPATDHGNAVIDYVYRIAEGDSVPSSTPWEFGVSHSNDELMFTISRLKPGANYTLEMAAQARGGDTGTPTPTSFTTPEFMGPHYTLSAPSSADEDETFTITVSRTNRNDGENTALIEIRDLSDGETVNRVHILAVEFGSGDSTVTVTYKASDDEQVTSDRMLKIRIGAVGQGSNDTGKPNHTYSVEQQTVGDQRHHNPVIPAPTG